MLTLQVPSPEGVRRWVWAGWSVLGNRTDAWQLLRSGTPLELWAGELEAAEEDTAHTWVGLLLPSASSPGSYFLCKGPASCPLDGIRTALRKATSDF